VDGLEGTIQETSAALTTHARHQTRVQLQTVLKGAGSPYTASGRQGLPEYIHQRLRARVHPRGRLGARQLMTDVAPLVPIRRRCRPLSEPQKVRRHLSDRDPRHPKW
jgi:hypothetical protein